MSHPLCPPSANIVSALVTTRVKPDARWLLPAEADRQRRPRSPAPSVLTPTLAASWEPMVCTGTARPTVGGRDSPQAGTRKRGRSLLPRGPTSTNRRQRQRRSRGAGRLRAGMWNTGGQSAPGRAQAALNFDRPRPRLRPLGPRWPATPALFPPQACHPQLGTLSYDDELGVWKTNRGYFWSGSEQLGGEGWTRKAPNPK